MKRIWQSILNSRLLLGLLSKMGLLSQQKQLLLSEYKWKELLKARGMNVEHPKTFDEKLQWLKIHDATPLKTRLCDKYLVRDWIKEKIGEEYLIPLLGVWDDANKIDFDALPNRFVLKANHGSGWNIVVKDKSKLDVKATRKTLAKWLKTNYARHAHELAYLTVPPKIIAEAYMEDENGTLNDYKVLCFHGAPKYIWVDVERHNSKKHRRNIYDAHWQLAPFTINYPNGDELEKPENLDKMVELASVLCQGFYHVRVDFYNIAGRIWFGEMTFSLAAGFGRFEPEEYNLKLGELLRLPGDQTV